MRSIIEKPSILEQRWMLVAVVALIFAFGWGRIDVASVQGQPVGGSLGAGGLITHFYDDPNGGASRVIVIDPLLKRMAVYHVPVDSGAIQLKSVRNLTADLQVQEFNSGKPQTVSPIDMQKMLERK